MECGINSPIHSVSRANHVSTHFLIHLWPAHLCHASPLPSLLLHALFHSSLQAQNLLFQQILPTLILLLSWTAFTRSRDRTGLIMLLDFFSPCTEPVLKIINAGYCLYVHIFINTLSHLNRLILTILINSCQTSDFSKVGAIIKYNIMHFSSAYQDGS